MSTKMLLLLLLSTVSSLLAFGQQLGHLDIAGTVTNATCSGEPNGAINISVAGGSPPYRYSWSIGTTSLGLTTEDISGLRGGFTYTVDVTDTQGMTGSASFLVHSEPFIVDAEIVNADCSANGSISLTPRNGVPPYSFRWDHGPTTATITNLAPGIYPVSYWDASGCSVGTKYMVEGVQNPMQLSFTKEDISCTAPTGSINLSVSGGQAPYNYRWNNGSTTEDLQGLAAGTYTVTVTDAASCSATQSIVLVEKSAPAIASTVKAATACEPGLADGGIQVQVSGGTSPYSYRWADGANTADRSGLQAGNYALTVVDAQGCAAAVEIVVPHAPVYPVIVFSTSANVACDANYTGSITAQINFTNSYSYSLTRNEAVVAAGGQVTSTDLYFASLSPGTYQLEVQQSNGCAVRTEIVVGEEAGVPVINAVTATPQGHCTFGDGTAAVTGISYNGTADRISDYVYTWTDASGTVVASSAYASNLPAGTYFVTAVKLSNPGSGCSSAHIEVVVPYEPSYATIELSSTPNTSCSTSFYNGTISAVFVSNYATYTWNWSKSGGQVIAAGDQSTTSDLTGLEPGEYEITLTLANGCTVSSSISVVTEIPQHNISHQKRNVLCRGENNAWIKVVLDSDYRYEWFKDNVSFTVADPGSLEGLAPGNYDLKSVHKITSCEYVHRIVVTEPDPIQLTETIKPISAAEALDGSITLAVAGGNAPYDYLWSNGETTHEVEGLGPGTYTVTVTDARNCTKSAQFLIEPKEPLGLTDGASTAELVVKRTASDRLQVSMAGVAHAQQLKIYRLDGRLVAIADVKGKEEVEITLPPAEPGLYVVVVTGKEKLHRKKILF